MSIKELIAEIDHLKEEISNELRNKTQLDRQIDTLKREQLALTNVS